MIPEITAVPNFQNVYQPFSIQKDQPLSDPAVRIGKGKARTKGEFLLQFPATAAGDGVRFPFDGIQLQLLRGENIF